MDRITTKRHPSHSPAPVAEGGFLGSPGFTRLHAIVTGVLLLGYVGLIVLAASGQLHFGAKSTANAAVDTPKSDDAPKDEKEKEGRYQIEIMDDARQVIAEAGKPRASVLGGEFHEAWVFRYKGGFLECKLETDIDGKPFSSGVVPENWAGLLGADDDLKQGKAGALNKEGYIVLLGMTAAVSTDEALRPLHPHLGAMFTTGPAGPLHNLIPYFHEVWRRREYRLFLCASPPKGVTGRGFNFPTWGHRMLIRTHFASDDSGNEPAHTTGGKDLEVGKEITILERQRGLSTVRLKAKFLTDAQAKEIAVGE